MEQLKFATLGGGCFWCLDAVFSRINGITSITSGYSGGINLNPTYEQVCTGKTGHAEVIQVSFDPKKLDYETLLDWFWQVHDPTTLNRQGGDMGTQYRSVIFFHSEDQKKIALDSKNKLGRNCIFEDPIVTEISKFKEFFPAEDHHQDYYRKNPNARYCSYVIQPKLQKLKLK